MGNPLIRIAIAVVLVFIVAVILYVRFVPGLKNQTENAVSNKIVSNEPAQNETPRFTNETNPTTETNSTEPTPSALANPTTEFKQRVTKKFFGTYIMPKNSPVQPEKFTGYHTAVDVEYTDTTSEIPVFALAPGKIVYSQTASGYGGVFVLQFDFQEKTYTAIYGHIRPATLPKVGQEFAKSQQIAVLGSGGTSETDGERHHLHFGIHQGSAVNIKGYVQNTSELSGWVDPLPLY